MTDTTTAGTPAVEGAAGPLDELGFVRVTGDDRVSFLQSMLSADVQALEVEHNVLTGWHDRAGRVQACMRVVRKAEEHWLVLPHALVELVMTGLRRYVLRSKVQLADASGELAAAGLFLDGGRFEIYAPGAALAARLEAHRNDGVRELAAGEWELADIRDGLPTVFPDTSGKFTAQMLNLDLIGGVSFTKGCYPGQEIIARTHHLGRAKRRMQRFVSDSATAAPAPGAPLHEADGSRAAVVVRAATDGRQTEALVVAGVERATPMFDTDSNEFRPAPLPYGGERVASQ